MPASDIIHLSKQIAMSILYKTASLKTKNEGKMPEGKYNEKTQTWEFQGKEMLEHKDFISMMGTFPISTYCVTTSGGWDQDTDDSLT